jgi:hypothetical protein
MVSGWLRPQRRQHWVQHTTPKRDQSLTTPQRLARTVHGFGAAAPVANTMNETTEHTDFLYAVRLLPPEPGGASPRIVGRIEHVLSGRCHDFDNGAALLACLAFEQQQATAGVR